MPGPEQGVTFERFSLYDRYPAEERAWAIQVYKPEDPGLRPGIVVGRRDPYSPLVIGTIEAITHMIRAYELLDNLHPGWPHRQIHTIFCRKIDVEKRAYVPYDDGLPFTKELLDRVGLQEVLDQSETEKYFPSNPENIDVGVVVDVATPIFFAPDVSLRYQPGKFHSTALIVRLAGFLEHELTHVLQSRMELPCYSPWSERQAASAEGFFMQRHLPMVPSPQKEIIRRGLRFISGLIATGQEAAHLEQEYLQPVDESKMPSFPIFEYHGD